VAQQSSTIRKRIDLRATASGHHLIHLLTEMVLTRRLWQTRSQYHRRGPMD